LKAQAKEDAEKAVTEFEAAKAAAPEKIRIYRWS